MTDPTRTLARWCSLAVLVEPALVRSLRLALAPELDASAEADLWWSPLVESRTTRGIVLTPTAADMLRGELRELRQQHDPRPAEAWEIIQAYHRQTTPAVRLEEEIAWLFVSEEDPEPVIEERLRAALAAIVNERRTGLGQWAGRAIPRLPEVARQQPSAWYLEQAAHAQLPHLASLGTLPPPRIDPAVLARLADRTRSTLLGVLRVGDRLYLGNVGVDGEAIDVAASDPRVVEVVGPDAREPSERSGPEGRSERRISVDVPIGALKRIDIGWGPIALRSTLGNAYDLPPLDGLDVRRLESTVLLVIDQQTGRRRLGVVVDDGLIATVSSTDAEEPPAVMPIGGSYPVRCVVLRRHGQMILLRTDDLSPSPAFPVRRLRRPPEQGRRWYGLAAGTTGGPAWEVLVGLIREPISEDVQESSILLQARHASPLNESQITAGGPLLVGGEIAGMVTGLVPGAEPGRDGDLVYGHWSDLWALLYPQATQATAEQWLQALADLLQALCLELHTGFRPLGGLELQDDRLTEPQLYELQSLAEAVIERSVKDLLTIREVLANPASLISEAAAANLDLREVLSALEVHDPRSAEPPLTASFVDELLISLRQEWSSRVLEPEEWNFRNRIESVLAPPWRTSRDRLARMRTPGFSQDLTLTGFLDVLLESYGRMFARVADRHGTRAYQTGYGVAAASLEILPARQLFDLDELDPTKEQRQLGIDRFATLVACFDWARAELVDAVATLQVAGRPLDVAPPQEADERSDELAERAWVRQHLRVEPHSRPVRVTVDTDVQGASIIIDGQLRADGDAQPPGDPTSRASSTQPLTAVGFLFGGTQDSVDALAHAFDAQDMLGPLVGTLQGFSRAGRNEASEQVATVVQGLLDLNLRDLIVAGWRQQSELIASVERTIANPGSSEIVELVAHRITSIHRPYVELLINDVHVATVRFELVVEFVVRNFVAKVDDGRLVRLHSGACEVTAMLAAEDRQLAKQKANFELQLLIRPLPALLRDGGPPPSATEWADGLDRSVAMDEMHSDFFGFVQVNPEDLLRRLASRWAAALGRMDLLDYWRWANTWWFDTARGFRILVYVFKVGPRVAPGYSLALLVTPFPDEGNERRPYDPWAYDNYKRELYDVVSQFGGERLPMDLALSQHYETSDFRRYTEKDLRIKADESFALKPGDYEYHPWHRDFFIQLGLDGETLYLTRTPDGENLWRETRKFPVAQWFAPEDSAGRRLPVELFLSEEHELYGRWR